MPEENVTTDDLDGLDPAAVAAAIESSEVEGTPEADTATPETDAALSRFGVSREDLPESLRHNPLALEAAVEWAVKREKDLQRGFTQSTEELRQKFGGDPDNVLEEANAFRVLAENPEFQKWASAKRAELEGRSVDTGVSNKSLLESAPAHLKGEALLDWLVDQKVNATVSERVDAVLSSKGYDQRLDLVSQYINKHELDFMRAKHGEAFDALRPDIEKNMRQMNVGVERAYAIARAEKGIDIEAIQG